MEIIINFIVTIIRKILGIIKSKDCDKNLLTKRSRENVIWIIKELLIKHPIVGVNVLSMLTGC